MATSNSDSSILLTGAIGAVIHIAIVEFLRIRWGLGHGWFFLIEFGIIVLVGLPVFLVTGGKGFLWRCHVHAPPLVMLFGLAVLIGSFLTR